jgi:hypothetical protein
MVLEARSKARALENNATIRIGSIIIIYRDRDTLNTKG